MLDFEQFQHRRKDIQAEKIMLQKYTNEFISTAMAKTPKICELIDWVVGTVNVNSVRL